MTVESHIEDPDDLLAAEYVLGVLPMAERVSFLVRLMQEPELQARVRLWESRFEPLSEEIDAVVPPTAILERVEEKLFDGVEGAEPTAVAAGWWRHTGFWRGLSVASLAALVLMVSLYTGILKDPFAPDSQSRTVYVSELLGEGDIVRLAALYEPETATLKFHRTQGAPAASRSFELWLITGDNNPVSLGVLPTAAQGEITLPADLRDRVDGAVLAISDEPLGGSPTGQPTGAVLAAGKLTSL